MTHIEAALLYPIREEFPAAGYGEAFAAAKRRVAELRASLHGANEPGGSATDGGEDFDGVLLPGLNDAEVFPGLRRWLCAATIYRRPRADEVSP